jgi:hypothetical protein
MDRKLMQDSAEAPIHAGERMSLRKELIITFHILAVLEKANARRMFRI